MAHLATLLLPPLQAHARLAAESNSSSLGIFLVLVKLVPLIWEHVNIGTTVVNKKHSQDRKIKCELLFRSSWLTWC